MVAILDFSVNQSHDINFDSPIASSDPKNMGVDTKTMALQLIIRELYLFYGDGGHLERHLEKKLFSRGWIVVDF